MSLSNIHKFSEITPKIENSDSKLIRESYGNNRIVFSGLSELISTGSDIPDYRKKEKKFLDNVIMVVQKRITDSSFDIKQFAIEMKVSESTLNRKINLLTGLSPFKLILSFRIEIALKLLLNNSLNISEIAYRAGFNDPRYFSMYFKNQVGLSPKMYRESIKRESIAFDIENHDDLFLEKALVKLDLKISDENLSFEQFALEMNMSKASLYRKIKSVAGLSPCELIRSVRIKRSAQLLTKYKNISEVAFAVGFNDSKYFSKCFKSKFGITPTQYQKLLDC